MLASRPMVSIRLDLPEPLIPIRTFSGRSSSGSGDSPNERRLHTEIRSIGMGIRSRTLIVGGQKAECHSVLIGGASIPEPSDSECRTGSGTVVGHDHSSP